MQEIILLKIESIEKCINRIEEKLNSNDYDILNPDIQDIIVLNLQRACQQSIDLAMFIVAELGLGVPKDSVDAFKKILEKNIISENTFRSMKGMIVFRNVAVHQYQSIDYVIKNRLSDFVIFNKELIDNIL